VHPTQFADKITAFSKSNRNCVKKKSDSFSISILQ